VIDPGAAVLAGVYGVGRPGSSANQPTDPFDAGAPAGSAGAIGAIGDRSSGVTIGSERHGTDTPDQSQDQSGRQSSSLSQGGAIVIPAASALTSPGAIDQVATASTTSGTPVAAGIGVTGPMTSAAAEANPTSNHSTRTSEITDQVMAQVGRQLQGARMLRDGTHHTVLRLSPEHLGDVTITLDVRAGGIRLDLAAGAQALVALQADLSQLRDDLAGSGLDLGEVTLSSQNTGPGTNGQAASRERWQEQASAGRESGGEGSGRFTERAPDRPLTRTTDGGLDVLV
jgi:flagellar hook-length control protein FliK